MVYSKKFVAVIKCNGKILRETSKDNDVILPFGAEYSILLKNLDHRRAVAEVSIDGVDVLVDDGFIRIKFGFERQLESTTTWITNHTYPTVYRSFYHESDIKYGGFNVGPTCGDNIEPLATANIESNVTMDSLGASAVPQVEEGITVPGSELSQDFNSTHVGTIENHDTIIIRLKGTDKIDVPVRTPLFVSTKKECPTCGTKSRYGTKFCNECGTNIQA